MSLWARMKRAFRSFFGFFVESMEDPELILKQNMRDLEDQIPALNENIATIKANETLCRKKFEKLEQQEKELTDKIKAALGQGNRELALNFAKNLEQIRRQKAEAERDLDTARQASEKALKAKKAFLAEMERKCAEARNALNAKKKADWQGKVADAMSSFKAVGVDATHEEMIRKIEQEAAQNEAKLEIALESAASAGVDLNAEAERLAADATLREFELEMGIGRTAGPRESIPADISEAGMGREKGGQTRERELA